MALSPSILARLEYQHQTIRELIENTPEEMLRQPIRPGKWSAFENIAHLTAYQPIFLHRLKRMQEEKDPEFPRYIAAEDPQFPPLLEKTLDQLLGQIDEQRALIFDQLKNMDEPTLERTGLHPVYGRFPVKKWAEFFLLHESHHLYTIFMLVQDLHKSL